jgi:hypothetical protein
MGHPQLGESRRDPVTLRQLEELYRTGDRKWNRLVQETIGRLKTQSDLIRQNSTTGFAL